MGGVLIQKVPAQSREYERGIIAVYGGRELGVNPGPATPETPWPVQSSYEHEKIRVFSQSRVTRHTHTHTHTHTHRTVATSYEILKTER